jgi:hypothetical protein
MGLGPIVPSTESVYGTAIVWERVGLEGEDSDEDGELESSGGVRCKWPRGEVRGYPTAGKGEEVGGANMPLDI